MGKRLIQASKFLSLVLRHQPQSIGLCLDKAGWASVEELVAKSRGRLSHDIVRDVVEQNDKQRFALSDDGHFIRANQGHSVDVDLGLESIVPPETLYHGTAQSFLEAIRGQGLTAQTRQHVHLSLDHETAIKVGQRHGRPVVLEVAALKMHAAGHIFYRSENGVWLTDVVPVDFLSGV
ncbi:MAG: RNA 2'-phosphotransferase [Pseudomonadota bacterium]